MLSETIRHLYPIGTTLTSVRKKIALQFIVSNLAIIANFALSIILARLLTPEEIGIFSMSAVLIAVAHVFRDFGVTAFIKREKELTPATIRAAVGVLVTTSWTVAALMFASAGHWAGFFNEPRVADVVRVLAIGFVFIPFGAIPSAILVRRMAVNKTTQVTAISTTVYFATSVTLAQLDFGYMTMAWANLVNIIVTGLAYHWALGERLPWLPSFSGWRRMVHFGAGNLITALLKAADNALPDVMLGRMKSADAVGLYSRANSTVNMAGTALSSTINYFAMPYMARLHHATGAIDQEYLRATSLINAVLLPALAMVAVLAHDIVLLLYGSAWLGSVEAIPWLCLAYGVSSLFTLTTPALIAIGKPYAAIVPLALVLLGKVGFALLLFDGSLSSFAHAMALGQLVGIPLYVYIARRHLGVGVRAWLHSTVRLVALGLGVGLAGYMLRQYLPQDTGPTLAIGVASLSAAVAYWFGCLILNLPIYQEMLRIQKMIRTKIKS